VLLTGTGRAFCSGQDLSEFLIVCLTLKSNRRTLTRLSGLKNIRKPVVCAVNGFAAVPVQYCPCL
jgi:enoyl-CoA hydratase/carnithine racemase